MISRQSLSLILAFSPLIASAEVVLRVNGRLLDHQLEMNEENENAPKKAAPDPAGDDLILFQNGDLMHGTFGGLEEGLLWERKDITRPIKFGIPSVKQIIFQSSRGLQFDDKISFITLASGDRIPGEIVSLDDKTLTLKGDTIGEISIPRDLIRTIAPNPFHGELYYIGPYTSKDWLTLGFKKEEEPEDQKEEEQEKEPSAWIHSGTAFYSQGTTPLILPNANLPEVGRLRFNVAWKGRLSIAIAMHSDLTRVIPADKTEEEKEEILEEEIEEGKEEEQNEEIEEPAEIEKAKPAPLRRESFLDLRQGETFQTIPWLSPDKQTHSDLFGTGYTLSLQSGYPTLTRNIFNDTGIARQERLNTTRSNASLGDNGEAEFEIRFDKKKAIIILYINGVYANQWHDLSGYLGQGSALGFLNRSSTSKVRISEISISSWGGSTDSARSMEHHDRDVALLTNGTDRFSGQLSHITEGTAHLKTSYSDIPIPLKELSLITLKKEALIDLTAEENGDRFDWKNDPITVVYQPYGLIQLTPISATPTTLTGHSPFLGEITVDLSAALLLRFSDDLPDLSDWFDDF